MGRLAWLYLAIAPACIDIPPFPSPDAGPPGLPSVTAIDDGNGNLVVENPMYRIQFENEAWRLPESLVFVSDLGSVQRLGFDHMYGENSIGISANPTYQVNSTASSGTAVRTIPFAGPVRATVEISWDGPALCAGSSPIMGNRSTFTFFPDGRFVRRDIVNAREVCDINLGTHVSLDATPIARAVWSDQGTVFSQSYSTTTDALFVRTDPQTGWLCVEGDRFTIAMTWRPPPLATDWDHIEFLMQFPTLSMSYYFAEDELTRFKQTYIADTAVFLRDDGSSCDTIGMTVVPTYQEQPLLMGASFRGEDGIYEAPALGAYYAEAEIARGFVLEHRTSASAISVTRTSSTPSRNGLLQPGVDYAVQADPGAPGTVFTLWFADALRVGEILTLD